MTESASPMHSDAAGKAPRLCDWCGTLFTPKRGWGRFCTTACRNAFHTAETRLEAIRERALPMYQALLDVREVIRGKELEQAWVNYPSEPAETLGQRLDAALKNLKAPDPIPALKAQVADLRATLDQVNKDADRRDEAAPPA